MFTIFSSTLMISCYIESCFSSRISTLGNASTYIQTDSEVYDIQIDLFSPGNLLLSDSRVLKTSDGYNTWEIAGNSQQFSGYQEGVGANATFYGITSFVQWNTSMVIVVDKWNHCLRSVNRVFNQTDGVAGECVSHGYKNDLANNSRFFYPTGIVKVGEYLVVADTYNMAIRLIRFADEHHLLVSTLCKGGILKYPQFLTSDSKYNIYITVMDGIVKIPANTNLPIALTSLKGGFADGILASSMFYAPKQLLSVDDFMLMIIDSGNKKVRVIDLDTGVVSSLLDVKSNMMRSLLLTNSKLYIGDYQKVRVVSVSVQYMKSTSDSATSATSAPFTFPTASTTSKPREVKAIVAQYDVECSVLDSSADISLLRAVMLYRYNQLEDIPGVHRSTRIRADYQCNHSVLTLYWPVELSNNSSTTITELSQSIQSKLDRQTASYFAVTIISREPPVMKPKSVCGHFLRLKTFTADASNKLKLQISSACN